MRTEANGIKVAWHDAGRGDPVVLIHGLADDHRAWRKVLPALMMGHRVILYDVRGHGESEVGSPDGSLRQLSEDLAALLHEIGVRKAALVGFSLGGTIAMRLAVDHPEVVTALVLVATSSRVGRAAAAWYEERARLAEARAPELYTVLEEDTRQQLGGAPGEFEEHWRIRRQSTADPRGYGNCCRAMAALRERPLDPELGRIRAPALVIAADRDEHCPPKAAEIIVAGVPGSRLELVRGSGHQVPIERPQEVATLIGEGVAVSG